MPDDIEILLRRLVGGDPAATEDITDLATRNDTPALLVAAALVSDVPDDLLSRAAVGATTTRDRQLVTIAIAHLKNDSNLLDALVREHLTDHPDNVLVAWIAAQHTPAGRTAGSRSKE